MSSIPRKTHAKYNIYLSLMQIISYLGSLTWLKLAGSWQVHHVLLKTVFHPQGFATICYFGRGIQKFFRFTNNGIMFFLHVFSLLKNTSSENFPHQYILSMFDEYWCSNNTNSFYSIYLRVMVLSGKWNRVIKVFFNLNKHLSILLVFRSATTSHPHLQGVFLHFFQ